MPSCDLHSGRYRTAAAAVILPVDADVPFSQSNPLDSGSATPRAMRVTPRTAGIEASPLAGVPRSKSHTQRALLIGAARGGATTIRRPLVAIDTVTLATALTALGAPAARAGGSEHSAGETWTVTGGLKHGVVGRVDVEENGTALRTLSMVVPLCGGRLSLDARPGLRRRPHAGAWTTLRSWGARVQTEEWPVQIDGSSLVLPDPLQIDIANTTQFASGALLGLAARHRLGLPTPTAARLRAARDPGYLELTASMLRASGFELETQTEPATADRDAVVRCQLQGWQAVKPWTVDVPIDPSSATFAHVLAALHRHQNSEAEWHLQPARDRTARAEAGRAETGEPDPHPERAVVHDIRHLLGAPPGSRLELDGVSERPDAFPALAVLAAHRPHTTRFANLSVLRGKESDRIAAIERGLHACGVECDSTPDSLTVTGPIRRRGPVVIPCPPDHRIVMAFALLGSVLDGGVEVDQPQAVQKSWPKFFEWLGAFATVTPIR